MALDIDVFGADKQCPLTEPLGKIGHVERDLGNIILKLSEEVANRAVKGSAARIRQPSAPFSGQRSCPIRDPFGHEWMREQEIEKVEPLAIQRWYPSLWAKW